jgi:hypothetical protein
LEKVICREQYSGDAVSTLGSAVVEKLLLEWVKVTVIIEQSLHRHYLITVATRRGDETGSGESTTAEDYIAGPADTLITSIFYAIVTSPSKTRHESLTRLDINPVGLTVNAYFDRFHGFVLLAHSSQHCALYRLNPLGACGIIEKETTFARLYDRIRWPIHDDGFERG